MKKYTGKGVYGAIAIGRICVFGRDKVTVKRIHVDDTEQEIKRLENAKKNALKELEIIYNKAVKEIGETNAQIFEVHMMLLEDIDYNNSIVNIIKTRKINAEYAIAVTSDNFEKMFLAMDDAYMKGRAADIKDISDRLISNLSQKNTDNTINQKVIICADDLAPSETVLLDKNNVLAFVTAYGSSNSHSVILAKNMNIPSIIGVGDKFLNEIKDGDFAIVDGFTGDIYINPDEQTLSIYLLKQKEHEKQLSYLQNLKGKENITLDGKMIKLYANIGSVDNIVEVHLNDAGGIGLFRSEFLYLERKECPTEEQQFAVYKRVLESMAGKKVIIRTFDIGADKQVDYLDLKKEENPALGCRAIRICLLKPELFRTQLRALYRASAFGNLGIMFPMITSVNELKEINRICDEVKNELKQEGIIISENIELGIMIETPAAAIISDLLAPMVDFFSIGTNDLVQYTLACDRQNSDVEQFCDTHHEAVLRLIEMTCQNAHQHKKWVGICGELASDITLIKTFLKMGIDELSVSPSFVLKMREIIRNIDLSK